MFSNPFKKKMDPLSFCQLVPCSSVLFVNGLTPAVRGEAEPLFFSLSGVSEMKSVQGMFGP